MLEFAPTGNQKLTQREVDQQLRDVSMEPRGSNPRVLGINMLRMMQAKNNGYPVDMYHPTLEMRKALKEEEEVSLASMGYQRTYIPKSYPKALFRRNMDARFEPQFDIATNIQIGQSFIEEKVCRDETQERELRAMKVRPGTSEWFERVTDVPPLDEAPLEDPKVTIARLQGKLAAYEAEQATGPHDPEVRRGPGRPRKEEQVPA